MCVRAQLPPHPRLGKAGRPHAVPVPARAEIPAGRLVAPIAELAPPGHADNNPLLALPGNKVGEVEDIGIGDRLEHLGHGGVVTGTHVPFVLSHRLDEKILALTGNARNVVAPREICVVADIAPVLAYESLSTLDARGIASISTRPWRRQLCNCVGKRAQIIVAEALHRIVHEVEAAQLLAKKKQLDDEIGRWLSAKRGYLRIGRLPVLAVARKAWGKALLDRCRPRRLGPGTE